MDKALFLKSIKGGNIKFIKGISYEILGEDDLYIYVKHPNCPKNKSWVSRIPKNEEGIVFKYQMKN